MKEMVVEIGREAKRRVPEERENENSVHMKEEKENTNDIKETTATCGWKVSIQKSVITSGKYTRQHTGVHCEFRSAVHH